ncbi:MAG: 50S ribosomal protein L4 [Thermoleophilaceae bacterium]|nr:50S ribosomal protein L4 [Thermoleophilaceae bacterium]
MAAPQAPYIGKQGKLALDESIFGERFHGPIVHEAVRAELAARRRGTASTKTRAEVAMTGAKAWRQKGTGRARVGALSTPNRTGGGVAFGPKPRGFTVKVNRKARRRALRAALALHAERGSIAGLDPSGWDAPSTKQAAKALASLDGAGSILVVLAEGEETCAKSFRNIAGVTVLDADQAGVADIVGAARIVVSEAALQRLGDKARAPEAGEPE